MTALSLFHMLLLLSGNLGRIVHNTGCDTGLLLEQEVPRLELACSLRHSCPTAEQLPEFSAP